MKQKSVRFLPEVLTAIAQLKEQQGFSLMKIITQVKTGLRNGRPHNGSLRNISAEVRSALKYATTQGIVKQRAGEFRINSRKMDSQSNSIKRRMVCQRKKRKQGRRRRRRCSKHSTLKTVSVPYQSNDEMKHVVSNNELHRSRIEDVKNDLEYSDDQHVDMGIHDHDHPCNNPDCFCHMEIENITNCESHDKVSYKSKWRLF